MVLTFREVQILKQIAIDIYTFNGVVDNKIVAYSFSRGDLDRIIKDYISYYYDKQHLKSVKDLVKGMLLLDAINFVKACMRLSKQLENKLYKILDDDEDWVIIKVGRDSAWIDCPGYLTAYLPLSSTCLSDYVRDIIKKYCVEHKPILDNIFLDTSIIKFTTQIMDFIETFNIKNVCTLDICCKGTHLVLLNHILKKSGIKEIINVLCYSLERPCYDIDVVLNDFSTQWVESIANEWSFIENFIHCVEPYIELNLYIHPKVRVNPATYIHNRVAYLFLRENLDTLKKESIYNVLDKCIDISMI